MSIKRFKRFSGSLRQNRLNERDILARMKCAILRKNKGEKVYLKKEIKLKVSETLPSSPYYIHSDYKRSSV